MAGRVAGGGVIVEIVDKDLACVARFQCEHAADACGRRDAGKFLEPHARTRRDLAIRADTHFGKCPAARMNHRTADTAIAHEQI